ncbi:MAG: hypothetical protein K0U93_00425 [Gammaproteobacteria bacterium]|nr:hypothetical protein [Gammaproteobacteria bacterium]
MSAIKQFFWASILAACAMGAAAGPNYDEGIYCTGEPVGLSDLTVLLSRSVPEQPRQLRILDREATSPAKRSRVTGVRCARTPKGYQCGLGELYELHLDKDARSQDGGYFKFAGQLRGISRFKDEALHCLVKEMRE